MSRTRLLVVVLALNLALVAGLLIVGLTAHSLAVLAAGGDYILDAAGVGVALLAIRLAARPASSLSRRGDWLDPAVALAIAIIVAYHAVKLTRKVLSQPSLAASPVALSREQPSPPSGGS
jgi:cobalt-zinc-cadmium efflux system protein